MIITMLTPTRFLRIFALLLVIGALTSPGARAQESTTLGGYGELHYNEPDGNKSGMLDFHRFVLFVGHSFNDKLSFKSEIELEHTKLEGGTVPGGELSIEQAYLDWYFSEKIGMRAGVLLPPVGIINLTHEPPTFNGVERPSVDRVVIPTTWRESGAGIYGRFTEGITYQVYVMAGLRASGFTANNGIRSGRQYAKESTPLNPSFTGRVDYLPMPELKVGGSFFLGNSTEGNEALGSGAVSLFSGDVQYAIDRFALRALGVVTSIGDADKINAAYNKSVGDQIYGYYIEGAYDILPFVAPGVADQSLSLFTRYEKYNTQASVTGFTADPKNDRNEIVVGATYKPTYNTVFKADYQFLNTADADANTKQLNLGIGYNF